jgi:hypothetical protein
MGLPLSLRQLGETPSIAENRGRRNSNAWKAKRCRLAGALAA